MTRILLRSTLYMTLALAALALTSRSAHAQVSITPTVVFDNGLYTYNYSVTNNTLETLAITTFEVRPLVDAVMMPTAPAGFDISFDSGLGLVSFFEDTDPATLDTFAPGSTVSGFMFTSPFQPTVSNFEALDINGMSFFGQTLAPANVPEPGTLALGATLALGVTGLIRTRRRHKATRA